MFWMCIRIAGEAILIHIQNIRFYGEKLKLSIFIIMIPTPDFPNFLLYVRWKSGVIFVRRCFRDVFDLSCFIDFKKVSYTLLVMIRKRFSLRKTNIKDINFGLVRMYVTPYRFSWTIFILGLALSYTDKLLVFRWVQIVLHL